METRFGERTVNMMLRALRSRALSTDMIERNVEVAGDRRGLRKRGRAGYGAVSVIRNLPHSRQV